MADLKLLASVALLEDLPQSAMIRGQVGTVVEHVSPDVYEIEFSDHSGRAYASVALRLNQLLELHHEPSHQVA